MPKSRLQKHLKQHEPPVWQKWNRRLILVILLCLLGIGFKVFTPVQQHLSEQERIIEGLEGQLRRENQVKTQLTEEVGWLLDTNDPRYLESIARDKLDLQSEGETVVRLESEPDPGNIAEETPEIIYGDEPSGSPPVAVP